MTGGISIEKSLEQISKRLERAERANRAMKIWSSIAFAAFIAFGSGPFASTVMAKKVKPPPALVAAQAFDLESSDGKVLATLKAGPAGGGQLTFFDTNGKRLALVGMSDDDTQAGLSAFDGNAIASGNGVRRTIFGVSQDGFGMAVFGADGLAGRVGLGSSLDGTTSPSALELSDSSGTTRTGLVVNPATDFVGFFSGILTGTSGPLESLVGNAYDNSTSFSLLYDSSGNLRNGIEYYPPGNFNGFFSQDGAGHTISSAGNFLTTDAPLLEQANESFLNLSDTTGTLRLLEFQNSTNEGGIDFNPGSTTVQGGWGNP